MYDKYVCMSKKEKGLKCGALPAVRVVQMGKHSGKSRRWETVRLISLPDPVRGVGD